MNFLFALSLLFVSSVAAHAEDMSCIATHAKDEFRPATLGVNCDGYASAGFVENEQKAISVTLEIVKGLSKRQVVINNPLQGLRAYYTPFSNEAVADELRRAKVKFDPSENIRLASFVVAGDTKIYKDSGPLGGGLANTPILGAKDMPVTNASGQCIWETTPQIVTTPSCGGNNLCYGKVICGEKSAAAMCQAVGAKSMECPSADVCAADPSVKFVDPVKPDPLPNLKGWDVNRVGGFHLDEGSAGEEAAKLKAKELGNGSPAN